MTNPASLQGWVRSADPKTGRVFYANHLTRKTQWEAPAGWVEETSSLPPPPPSYDAHNTSSNDDEDEEPLPSNWEVMHDPTTGKPFYVDHESKITTWTRPKIQQQKAAAFSLQPAPASGGHSAALARILSSSNSAARNTSSSNNNYYNNFAPTSRSEDVDLSDSLPPLDFKVQTVADALRPYCAQCSLEFTTLRNRRHHCRLCGDVFCDACSPHRVNLPLEGVEFEKPVRVCDLCKKDVDKGNFFSMRRYLTPLHLCNPNNSESKAKDGDGDEDGVATLKNVNAALSAMTVDLDQMTQNVSDGSAVLDKISIPPDILIPEIAKHLANRETSNRAICAVASLLALESFAGGTTHDYASAVYSFGNDGTRCKSLHYILLVLERSGTDRRTLFVQEQAARTLYYLTEPKTIIAAQVQQAELASQQRMHKKKKASDDDDGDADNNDADEFGSVEDLDLRRAVRSLLDHSSASKNPNLQRWAAACIKNIVQEDQRRACLAMNDVAAAVASGEPVGSKNTTLEYESVLEELVNTGGIMILCSLCSTDDADTRAHAVGALGAALTSTRAIDASMAALSELSGGAAGRQGGQDGTIVRAIVAGGGCASSVSQLLLSADNAVASMGCSFLSALVMPLLSDPMACVDLPLQYDYRNDHQQQQQQQTSLAACREAAVEIATDSCLPALLSLVRNSSGHNSRPMELRKMAMETLAAVTMSVGLMGKSWAQGQYEEGLERSGAPAKLKDAILLLNEEGVVDGALEVLQSSAGQSLGSTNETHASRIREAAGIVLGSLTSCSAEAILELQTRKVLSPLLLSSNDASMTVQSTLRGDAAPRCLGVLETMSCILMFAWQHPSGASSELLDRLIEMIDAGAIPYISKVLNSKIDWESKDKSVGAMKARAASCRLLCCLFGIALSDSTAIGMRRLMDAVDADARSYRGGDRAPRDIIEATLGVLQTSTNYARRALMGSLNQGSHYQAALLELVDAALLAAGSMCGSSVAPGGSEGIMVTGESFLASRNDQYVGKRKAICKVACDVVVRGGRTGPSLLPTMLVGGFGEGSILSALRLALAIGQNGSKDEHAKLALSGLLVPISDSLRAALSGGDLYRFSASLALVRFCGPHVAAGQGGGIESVRDAIRVATNVLTLPVNPEASIEQMETQESLKSECISALESLSRNASLWSSISTEALPSIVQYFHTTAGLKANGNYSRQATRCTALRAVLQIVQVPSHAVSAAEAGIVDPLGKLLKSGFSSSQQEDEVSMLALEVLHVISSNKQARQKARFLSTGLVRSICSALGKAATEEPKKPSDSRADVTFLGLNILHAILSDIEDGLETQMVLQSQAAIAFIDAVSSERQFVRALCATLLLSTDMKVPRHDSDQNGEPPFDIPRLYGPPLVLVPEKCAGFDGTHEAAASILYTSAVFACAVDSQKSDDFWKTVLVQDLPGDRDTVECSRLALTLCAHFLALLTLDYKPFMPSDAVRMQDYILITRPLVRYRLLESLKDLMDNLTSQSNYGQTSDPYVISLLVGFNVPHICLSLWKDPAILDLAFELIKQIVEQEPDEVLHLFVEGKAAIMSLFDLLNLDSSVETSKNIGEIRRFLASLLGQLAESGLLTTAIERFDVRSSAIAALAAACLSEEERPPDEDEDMTSNRLSSVLMRCLVDLCTVKGKGDSGKRIRLSSAESEAIAKNLGKKICQMVLSRFLERAKLEQYEIEHDEDITDAPDVAMLCAIAQHEEALLVLRSIGGLHALSLVAAEGELSAMVALKKACNSDASVLLEGDTYQAVMGLLVDEQQETAESAAHLQLHSSAFELLAQLSSGSAKGRKIVSASASCQACVQRAMDVVCSFTKESELEPQGDASEEETADKQDVNTDPADSLAPPPYTELTSNTDVADLEKEKVELGIAACAFLSALVPTNVCRDALLENEVCLRSLSSLSSKGDNDALGYASLKVLSALAPYTSSDGALSADHLSEVLLSVLTSERKILALDGLNANLMYNCAVTGANIVFDCISDEKQKSLALSVASLFRNCVKSCSITRSTTRESEKVHSAELTHNLSLALLLVRGKTFAGEIYTQDLLTSFIHLVQWRYDPKTSLGNTDQRSWDAAVSNSLLLLSTTIWKPDTVLESFGISLRALAGTSLMLARPGKAPRKAIDLRAALERLAGGQDAAAALSAQRIIDRLF